MQHQLHNVNFYIANEGNRGGPTVQGLFMLSSVNVKKSTIHPLTNLTQSPPSIKFDDCNCLDAIHISNLFCRELCEPEVLCELVALTL